MQLSDHAKKVSCKVSFIVSLELKVWKHGAMAQIWLCSLTAMVYHPKLNSAGMCVSRGTEPMSQSAKWNHEAKKRAQQSSNKTQKEIDWKAEQKGFTLHILLCPQKYFNFHTAPNGACVHVMKPKWPQRKELFHIVYVCGHTKEEIAVFIPSLCRSLSEDQRLVFFF